MDFLKQNNLLPYIAIVIMGYFMYQLIQSNVAKDLEIANEKAEKELMNKNIGTIQNYTMLRIDALEKINKTEWKEGKHEVTLFLNK